FMRTAPVGSITRSRARTKRTWRSALCPDWGITFASRRRHMDNLDRQMQAWSTRLRDDLKIGPPESNQLATTIAKEVASLSKEAKQRIRDASQIPLATRIEELVGFQAFMDHVRDVGGSPGVVR